MLRYLRLAIAAARADGTISGAEREHLLSEARQAGLEGVAQRELDAPRPLREIVAGVSDPALRRDLYKLAFAIVRADEGVSNPERLWLGQLSLLLELDPVEAARRHRRAEGASTRGVASRQPPIRLHPIRRQRADLGGGV